MEEVTVKEIEELFKYDPKSGLLTWRISRGRAIAGSEVGYSFNGNEAFTKLNGKAMKVSHLIWILMTGEFPKERLKFADRNKTNLKWDNIVTSSQQVESKRKREYYGKKKTLSEEAINKISEEQAKKVSASIRKVTSKKGKKITAEEERDLKENLGSLVEEFQKAGGKINKIPIGVSGDPL